ncbi:MAG: aminotransferase class V-fold PLP-dependent enzyme [Bacillota bacterium]
MQSDSKYRELVVGVSSSIPLANGSYTTAINFDNAATTPPFVSVMNAINSFAPWYSSIHRGTGYKSQYSSDMYEKSREIAAAFVKADTASNTVVYVKNTTEAINKISYRLFRKDNNSIVLSTAMEHHSNDLPWRGKYKVDYVNIDSKGYLSLQDLERKLKKYHGHVKLVAVSGASNVTGYKNDIHTIAELAHKHRARILVDGAQLVPHSAVDVLPDSSPGHIDFLVFSGHKMYAPFGTGVLIGPLEDFESRAPEYTGGGTIDVVTHDLVRWAKPPAREEAGTPNIMGVVALTEAIKTLSTLGMSNIEKHEKGLVQYALTKLNDIPGIIVYGNRLEFENKVSIIPFNVIDLPHQITAAALSYEYGIAVRSGCFCAQPYVQSLLDIPRRDIKKYTRNPDMPRPGMVRISFGLYNTYEEIDVLYKALLNISSHKSEYLKKYESFVKQH